MSRYPAGYDPAGGILPAVTRYTGDLGLTGELMMKFSRGGDGDGSRPCLNRGKAIDGDEDTSPLPAGWLLGRQVAVASGISSRW